MDAQSEWSQPGPSVIWWAALEEIIKLRRLMLVHCCIYYRLDDALVSDHQWQEWANYLTYLQDSYGWRAGFYDADFKDWDGSTGYHLPAYTDVMRVARRTLEYARSQRRPLTKQRGLFA